MDYLQRDAYYTGVSYGHFDMERILRVMRPREGKVIIKSSGMHAVEDYIMSRYQMYLQVYFHPVSRSAEVLLNNILKRAKQLNEEDYQFALEPTHFKAFFENSITIEDYLALDEYILLTYFQFWMKEKDPILSDLCSRFVNRKLFQYSNLNPEEEPERFNRLKDLLLKWVLILNIIYIMIVQPIYHMIFIEQAKRVHVYPSSCSCQMEKFASCLKNH